MTHSVKSLTLPLCVVLAFTLPSFCQTDRPAKVSRSGHPTTSLGLSATTSRAARRSSTAAVPADALPAISAAPGADDAGYHVRPYLHGYQATNSRQNLVEDFTPDGVTVTHAGASLRLMFSGYGFGNYNNKDMSLARDVRPVALRSRVEYRRGPLVEWYINGPLGLEQGFTLHSPPSRKHSGRLAIALDYSGDLQPQIEHDDKTLILKRRDGHVALRYSGLEARDADGRVLMSSMELHRNRLRLLVDDRAARYPIDVDPVIQAAVLTASSGVLASNLGLVISRDGNTIAVMTNNTAQAYIFERQGASWTSMTEVRQLSGANGQFSQLAISDNGDTILRDTFSAPLGKPEVSVYVRPGASWSGSGQLGPVATLLDPDPGNSADFGRSLAISGDSSTAVVGDDNFDPRSSGSFGALFVFRRGAAWTGSVNHVATLIASPTEAPIPDELGFSVAIDHLGDVITAGSLEPGAGTESARVFFAPNGDPARWADATDNAILHSSDNQIGDRFGQQAYSIAIDSGGSAIAVGAFVAKVGSNTTQGKAYVFVNPGEDVTGWTSTNTASAILVDGAGTTSEELGFSISVSDLAQHVLVGSGSARGAVEFDEPSGGWSGTVTGLSRLETGENSTGSLVSIDSHGDALATNGTQKVFVFGSCTTLAPSAFDFGEVPEGTKSTAQPFTLTNHCVSSLDNIAITFDLTQTGGSDFSQTNDCGSTLLGNGSCTINVSFSPTAAIQEFGGLIVADSDSSSSPQLAGLSGTGVCNATLSPGSFDFGTINDGSSSAPKSFTLSNLCDTALTGVAVSVTGTNSADFSQTNTCGTSVAVGASCTIDATFHPSNAGPESATLQVADSASSSPQQAALTGTGQGSADYSLASTAATPPSSSGSTTSATVTAGDSATYTLELKSIGGFNTPVALSAAFSGGAPAGAGFTFSVSPITPTASGATSTLTVTTVKAASATPAALGATGITGAVSTAFLLLLCGAVFLVPRKTGRRLIRSALAAGVVFTILGLGGCNPTKSTPGPTTVNITVTANGGGITHTTGLKLVVQ